MVYITLQWRPLLAHIVLHILQLLEFFKLTNNNWLLGNQKEDTISGTQDTVMITWRFAFVRYVSYYWGSTHSLQIYGTIDLLCNPLGEVPQNIKFHGKNNFFTTNQKSLLNSILHEIAWLQTNFPTFCKYAFKQFVIMSLNKVFTCLERWLSMHSNKKHKT